MMDTISVMLCAYNAENTLEKAVTSVLDNITVNDNGEELFDIQLVVIDNGSTDSTLEIIERIQESDSRVIAVHQENKGIAGAREASLKYMSGRYYAFCDADDWVEPDWLLSMYRYAKKYSADIVRFRALIGDNICKFNPDEVLVWNSSEAIKEFFIHKKINAMLQMELIDSSLFKDVHFDTSLKNWEDQSVALQLLSKAGVIVRVNDAKYHYCVNPNGISNGHTNAKRIADSLSVMDSHISFCKNNGYERYAGLAEKLRRRWMLAELKAMYRDGLNEPIEKQVVRLFRQHPLKSLSKTSIKDRIFLMMLFISPHLTKIVARYY